MESNSTLIECRGLIYYLKEWAGKLKFSEIERRIINSRMNGFSFNQENEDYQKVICGKLMVSVSVMHGCNMPDSPNYLETAVNFLNRFILENGFGKMTFDEMILSFELNMMGLLSHEGIAIDFTGVNFNVSFVAKVFKKYMISRSIIDGKIKNEVY